MFRKARVFAAALTVVAACIFVPGCGSRDEAGGYLFFRYQFTSGSASGQPADTMTIRMDVCPCEARTYRVYVDLFDFGVIACGETKQFGLATGSHEVFLRDGRLLATFTANVEAGHGLLVDVACN